MWNTGQTLENKGGFWEGPCIVTVSSSTGSYWFANPNPQPITFTFSRPVFDVDFITVESNRCVGGFTTPLTYTAYDESGAVVQEGVWDQSCNEVPNFIVPRIKSIRVTPPVPLPPNNSSGYALSFMFDFLVACPTTLDPVFDDEEVRRQINLEWSRAKGENLERAGWIYQNAETGGYTVWTDTDSRRDRCGVDMPNIPSTLLA
jgi:hypothetical protein